ncbi:response regulator [Pyrinomonas sp.]|uniref:LytR/AlgR family response regulator transcription factor n=1 Tax=Pyrinomonas sp. TaxID=2080306 RepID=UPI0033296FEE
MSAKLRVVIADDERPARSFLAALLRGFEDVEVVGEAETGIEAIKLIESERPDLALLDLQMPEASGLDVVRLLRRDALPLVAFVTAYDDYAVKAFELNAIDYLVKPVQSARLRGTLNRAQERLERAEVPEIEARKLRAAIESYDEALRPAFLERIPVRQRDEIILLPVREVASVVAEGELLHLTTLRNKTYLINYRLKDLEAKLNPADFIRLSRGALVNVEAIRRVVPMPGGTYQVELVNDQELPVSRRQSRALRERLLRL